MGFTFITGNHLLLKDDYSLIKSDINFLYYRYGLIVPEKSKPLRIFQASHNIFGHDSDSEEESKKKPVLLQPSDTSKRQV